MKVASAPAATLTLLSQQQAPHDAGYETLKLQRAREIYAALYQRMQDALRLDDEGYEVSIVLRGPSRTLTLTADEADTCFNLNEIYAVLGKRLSAKQAEIMDLLLKVESGTPLDSEEGTDDPLLHQALALCLPAATAPALPARTQSIARAA